MKRKINSVAVIGSGVMGSGIACHFANIGIKVLLLDIAPNKLNESEEKLNLSLEDKVVKNRIVNEMFQRCIKSKPAPLYHKNFAKRITLGNLSDDINKISKVDWIIEVVTEKLSIKQIVFEQIEKYRTKGTLVTSNTSGIPIKQMNEGRSEDFKSNFAVTHFFNPPRYLKLFEIIPGPDCNSEIIDFLNDFGERYLGKDSVLAKDTPGFIGNRIGTFGMVNILNNIKKLDLSIEEIDKLTGPIIGSPKSATFRTSDIVGLDTTVNVATGIYKNCLNDEFRDTFKLPKYIYKMLENNWLGSKTNGGFYKRIKDENGKSTILSLDLESLEYSPVKKVSFETISNARKINNVIDRFSVLLEGKDKAGEFYRFNFGTMFSYIQNRIPEISNELYKIDDALKAGFGWKNGPFQIWDSIGIKKGVEIMKSLGYKPAEWISEMTKNNVDNFYKVENRKIHYYDLNTKSFIIKPGQDSLIILNNLNKSSIIWENSDSIIKDLGDEIINLEFRTKMNTLGQGVLMGINKAVDLAEKNYKGIVIGNEGSHFSAGANLGAIFMASAEQEYDEINFAIKFFQDSMMKLRYSSIPVIAAPHGLTLGGGCEVTMHSDKAVVYSESYIGLVEVGAGLIPGGGGCKEMALRASKKFSKNDVELNVLQEYFLNIGMAKTSTSAYEAIDLGYLQPNNDTIIMNKNHQISIAKKHAILMSDYGYLPPCKEKNIKVLGKQALGMFMVGSDTMKAGGYISEHDQKIANKIAYVISGGDLSQSTLVNEQYLLDLEREAFLSLCSERKTLERIQYILKTGKPLRN
ncbi:MAG: 3-hydroxyacyl-CoA dehydrogenase [Flavobacteriaceae bacterium]|jgi:3-hydroxyacyl-CoA dehydrogenase|nr:3-hydroxyacyl-CoA dehydrogenase [Flavobacteriaceae bacterium]MBT6448661.1 3-hydroxyacyl-CoA dehydrogenase [Flavobacteriaceae bacterium]MDG1831484.1 3-hydroxyacyl-CoA dehydrogenase NAD-binding domain-containing protein [Flavobacteriaceae bacterium]